MGQAMIRISAPTSWQSDLDKARFEAKLGKLARPTEAKK